MQRLVLLPINILIDFFEGLGKYTILMATMFRSIGSFRDFLTRTLDQMVIIGANSIPIVMLTTFFQVWLHQFNQHIK